MPACILLLPSHLIVHTHDTVSSTMSMQPYPHRPALKRKPIAHIRKNKKTAFLYADPATLRPLGAQARDVSCARARRIPILKEQIIVRNFKNVKTLVLLRTRAKIVRDTYKRNWECIVNLKPRKFLWASTIGDVDAVSRQEALLTYINAHLPLIDSMATRIRLSETATERWGHANRSAGGRHRTWMEWNEAIAVELLRREGEVTRTAPADDQDSAQAEGNPTTPNYPAQFAVDVAHIIKSALRRI